MAIYTIAVTGIGKYNRDSLNNTFTIEANTEAEAKRKMQERMAVNPQYKFLPASAYNATIQEQDFADQLQKTNSAQQTKNIKKKEAIAKKKAAEETALAEKDLATFQSTEGEEAAQTAFGKDADGVDFGGSFSDFADDILDPGRNQSFQGEYQPGITRGDFSQQEILPPTPVSMNQWQDPAKIDTTKTAEQLRIEAAAAAAEMATGGATSSAPYQTEAGRRGQLENTNSFAAFLDELDKAGLGGLQGSAGRYIKDQYHPLKAAYEAQQILPLAQGGVPFGQDLRNLAPEDAEAYQGALARQQANKYVDGYGNLNAGMAGGFLDTSQGPTAPFTKEEDEATIAAYSPSFGAYAQGSLQGGGRQAQQRIGQQLQSLSQIQMEDQAPGSFASQMLAPENQEQAGFLQNLAAQAVGGRYSSIARNALSRFINPDDIYSQYVQQSTPQVGADMTAAPPPPNFAQFIGQRYGLF